MNPVPVIRMDDSNSRVSRLATEPGMYANEIAGPCCIPQSGERQLFLRETSVASVSRRVWKSFHQPPYKVERGWPGDKTKPNSGKGFDVEGKLQGVP